MVSFEICAMAADPVVSIVIPTYNRYARLEKTLDALAGEIVNERLTDSIEVLIVDDCSQAGASRKLQDHLVRKNAPWIRYIRLEENSGPSSARNRGIQECRGELVAFLDDDVLPAEDYVRKTKMVHRRHPECLVISGQLRQARDDLYSQFWFYYYDAVFNKPGKEFFAIEMISSGHFSIKRELLDLEEPLFDHRLRTREDFDLYLRLKQRGIPVYKADDIVAFIDCRDSLWKFFKQRLGYARGERMLREKHGAAFVLQEEARYHIPRHRKFWALYLALRVGSWGYGWLSWAQGLLARDRRASSHRRRV